MSQESNSFIPIIDFADWSGSVEARQDIAEKLVAACHNVGFVYIVNHGISEERLKDAFGWTKKLFDLSHEEKMLAPHPPGPENHRGYSYPGLEKVSQVYGDDADDATGKALREVKDCKESYEIGSETSPRGMYNIWLPEEVLPGFRDFSLSFYWECNGVAKKILTALAIGLGLESADALTNVHSGHNNQLRLLHYPPIKAAELERQTSARMPAHSDWGTITMLFQDDCGGLQVEDPHVKGNFDNAPPVKNALIMNIGDMLMRWSNDYLKSTLHRVTLPPLSDRFEGQERMTRARYSIPYFLSPNPETVVKCMEACNKATGVSKYEPIEAGEYLKMRGKLQYETTPVAAAAA